MIKGWGNDYSHVGTGSLITGSLVIPLAGMLLAVMLVTGLSTHALANDDLCPDVDAAKQQAPRDSSDMQASIERLNLCVERARLLKQLDDLARQRDEILRNVTSTSIGVDANSLTGVPSLPSAALPSLPTDVTGLQSGDVRVTGAASNPLETAGRQAAQESSPVVRKSGWKVRKIWGQGSSMRAQITDGSGALLNVQRGDVMPDDSVVESVSVKGVAISHKGKVSDLPWDDTSFDTGAK